jgi:GT2 family glycosyltransferase/glycosyltransferase involved in cell wall biosynthesis
MSRVAIASYDVQTINGKAGGVGAFTTRWAKLLRSAGESVTIVMTRMDWQPMRVDPKWRSHYQAENISLIELQAPPGTPTRWPEVPTMRMAEVAAPLLRGFDVVYFQDWGNSGFHLMRERRYSREPGPTCVTVLHGPSEWELSSNGKYPDLPTGLHLAYQERYSAKHSDFVLSPSRYMAGHLKSLGWEFPAGVEVLGLPMPRPECECAPARRLSAPLRRIVYFGRVEERKGIRVFVAALQRLAKAGISMPLVTLLGDADDGNLLQSSIRDLKQAGLKVSHERSLDSDGALRFLRENSTDTLCVIPSPADNHPYTVVEASLISGLNVIACRGGGVPEILQGAAAQLCDPLPQDLANKIAERIAAPLAPSDLVRYECDSANARWLEFHRKAVAAGKARSRRQLPDRKLTVDVCTTYYKKAAYLSQFVSALENQTDSDFHVIAVDDGSPDAESKRAFQEQASRTAKRGWDFYSQENAFVDAARNSAARRGNGDLILFVDSDDVPARNAIARMREAITLSGDDAIICASYYFASKNKPFDPATGEVLIPPYATCIPLGIDLVGGLINPAAFGGSMFIIRRSVFEEMGGFRELRGAGHEEWEFYVRLALAGYRIDVLPELLQYYRQVEDGLARTLPSEPAKRRLLSAYEDSLKAVGLQGGALALAGLYRSGQDMELRVRQLSMKMAHPSARFALFSSSSHQFESGFSMLARLRNLYRELVPLEARLKFHATFLAPFLGPYIPPSP